MTSGQVLYVDVGWNGEAGGNPDAFPIEALTFGKGGFNGGSDGGGGSSPFLVLYGGERRRRRRRLRRTYVSADASLPRRSPGRGRRRRRGGAGGAGGESGFVWHLGGAVQAYFAERPGGAAPPGTAAAGGGGGVPAEVLFLDIIGESGRDGALGDGGAGGRNQFGGVAGGGGGGLHGGGGGGSGVGDVPSRTQCTGGGGGGGSSFFASATTNTALPVRGRASGVPRVTLTYSPPGGGVAGGAADRLAPSLSKPKLSRKHFASARSQRPRRQRAAAGRRPRGQRSATCSPKPRRSERASTASSRITGSSRRAARLSACATRRNRKGHKRCTLYKKAGTLTRQGALGKNSFAFSGRIGDKKLAAGSYQLTLTPTDRAGNTGIARTLRFQIVR